MVEIIFYCNVLADYRRYLHEIWNVANYTDQEFMTSEAKSFINLYKSNVCFLLYFEILLF